MVTWLQCNLVTLQWLQGEKIVRHTLLKTADPNRQALVRAATLLARQAWNRGQDVHQVLEAAGYAQYIVEGIYNYVSTTPEEQDPITTTTTQEMPPKRARISEPKVKVAPAVKKYVKKCMDKNTELKSYFKTHTSAAVGTSGTMDQDLVSNIVLGTADDNRIASQIHVRRIYSRGYFIDSVLGVGRIIIGYDKSSNLGSITVNDVLATNDVNSCYNANQVVGHGGDRILIVHDKRHTVSPGASAIFDVSLDFAKWRGNKVTTYVASTGAVTDVLTGNWFWMWIGANATIQYAGTICFEYVDN